MYSGWSAGLGGYHLYFGGVHGVGPEGLQRPDDPELLFVRRVPNAGRKLADDPGC